MAGVANSGGRGIQTDGHRAIEQFIRHCEAKLRKKEASTRNPEWWHQAAAEDQLSVAESTQLTSMRQADQKHRGIGLRRWWQAVYISVAVALCVAVLALAVPVHAASLGSSPSGATEGPEVRVIGRMSLNLNDQEQREFEQLTLDLAGVTRQQDRVTSYSCNRDIEHPGTYVFDEVWPSEQALTDHLATEHFKAWWRWVEPHLDGSLAIGVSATESFHPYA